MTKTNNFSALVNAMRADHESRNKWDIDWRKTQLKAIKTMLKENEELFAKALNEDMGKSTMETYITETSLVLAEVNDALKNIDRWVQPEKASIPLRLQPASGAIVHEPLGVTLIIGAWNYPLTLTLNPLVAAIAAGNSAIIKPSEVASATAQLLDDLLPEYLDNKAFAVVQGDKDVTSELLEERFDKIFFTGGKRVGSIIMQAAAKHVTPVTLELGGKSPAIVDSTANLDIAANRIVFGKYTNAGQTCVAPDYVLADETIVPQLMESFKRAIRQFYGENPQESKDYSRLINEAHFNRVMELMEGQETAHGGAHDRDDLYIEPTILANVDPDSPVMKEEIFGPVLPVIPVKNMTEAFNFVSRGDKPLALYTFSRDKDVQDMAWRTSAGAVGINDAVVHPTVATLPFGGVGGSGFGKYHGEYGFKDFSNAKAVFNGSSRIDAPLRYPPYKGFKEKVLRWILG